MSGYYHIGSPDVNPSLSDILGANNVKSYIRQPISQPFQSPDSYGDYTPDLFQTLSHPDASVLAIAASKKYLFSATQSGLIKVWDSEKLSLMYILRTLPHVGDILSLAYCPKSRTVFLGCQDTSIQWFCLDHIEIAIGAELSPSPVLSVPESFTSKPEVPGLPPAKPFFPATRTLLDREIVIPTQWVHESAHSGYVYSLLIGPIPDDVDDSAYLFSGSGDGSIKVWKIEKEDGGVRLIDVRGLGGAGLDTVFSLGLRDGLLYAGLQSGLVDVFDLETHQRIRTLMGHHDAVLALVLLGDALYTADSLGLIKQWNRSFECTGTLMGHKGLVQSLVLADGPLLISGGSDQCVRLWRIPRDVADCRSPTSFRPTSKSASAGERRKSFDELLHVLDKWVRIPTISGQVGHLEDCRLGAKLLKNLLVQLGAEARLVQGLEGRNPLVYGSFRACCLTENEPIHLVFYGHYDVVSARPKEWASDPFQLLGKDGYLYGRGVADNKGPILAAVFAVSELLQEKRLPINITFLIEGEEESGSAGFYPAVDSLRSTLGQVDLILLSNSYWLGETTPCITYGLRGVIHASIKVSNQQEDVHSGVYGGVIVEPLIDLTHLLAKLISQDKRILIPGFYDNVRNMTPDCDSELATLVSMLNLDSPSKLQSQWSLPTLTIHKIGTSGPNDQTTVIPSWARADISMRIVPDQGLEEVAALFKSHVQNCFKDMASGNSIDVYIRQTADWWLGDTSCPYYELLKSVIGSEWGTPPMPIREGGSIPAVKWLEKELNAPVVHLPMGQSSDQAHLANERLRVRNLQAGKAILKEYFVQLGAANTNTSN